MALQKIITVSSATKGDELHATMWRKLRNMLTEQSQTQVTTVQDFIHRKCPEKVNLQIESSLEERGQEQGLTVHSHKKTKQKQKPPQTQQQTFGGDGNVV